MPSVAIINALSWWVGQCRRFAWVIVISALVFGAVCVEYARTNLGINTDTADMIARDLPWRQTYIKYKKDFPQFVDILLVVVDGDNPDLAAEAAARLAEALGREDRLVDWVDSPQDDEFFKRNGLLYLDRDELQRLSDSLARAQPFLGALTGEPTMPGFFSLLVKAMDASGQSADIELTPVLKSVANAVEARLKGQFYRMSWQEMIAGSELPGTKPRRFLIVKPKLDYTELFPAGPVLEEIRAKITQLELTPERGVRVRVTGGAALAHEELESVTRGATIAAIASLLMVTIILLVGLRSLWFKLATLITLGLGLCWTAAFATLAIGHLNLISVAFAVLYIGLGVSYAIHYCLRCHEVASSGVDWPQALDSSARDVGAALFICAVTTGVGFFAFVPTDFTGVSELGIISGTGMFISLAASLTVLPALLTILPTPKNLSLPPTPDIIPVDATLWSTRHRRAILTTTAVLALLSLVAVPYARFDDNPLNLREAGSESVSTFRDLMSDKESSPWTLSVMANGISKARELAPKLRALPEVGRVTYLESLVPEEQDQKLNLIDDLALLLSLDSVRIEENVNSSNEARSSTVKALLKALENFMQTASSPARAQARRLHDALTRLSSAGGSADGLAELERSLMHFLPPQLEQLQTILMAGPVTLDSIPERIRRDWITKDGRLRLKVEPAEDLNVSDSLDRFIASVRSVAPDATGAPVINMESGRAVVHAFIQALFSALVIIAILLFLLLRKLRDVTLVLVPLLFATLLTVACMVLLDVPFNFANVIALPLLLGIGVDNGIHMVHRWRAAPPASGDLLQTSTARAVVISALTTMCSFGNLAYSPHQGTASMGLLLTIGLGLVLVCTLLLIPAMQSNARTDGGA